MIARMHILLPFKMLVPEKEEFSVWEYLIGEIGVRIFPPAKSSTIEVTDGQEMLVNGVKSFETDVLHIEFHKNEFNRAKGIECDPPFDVIEKAINGFNERLRYVTKSSRIKPIGFPSVHWKLEYLQDDGSEFEPEEDLVRGRFAHIMSFETTVLNREVWDDVHTLDADWRPPVWQSLLLDAQNLLPEVGPSIVLAATALEVFISQTLDLLAIGSDIPDHIWKWVNQRDWLKKPSLEEQFDFLLGYLSGSSLKEDLQLWESFKNLKNARNSFVHDGVPTIGNTVVTVEGAAVLISKAQKIIESIESNLPDEHKLPVFKHDIEVTVSQLLRKGSDGAD